MDLNEKAMQTIKGWQDEQNLELISRINILEDATDLLIDPDFSTLSDTERLSLIANIRMLRRELLTLKKE